MRFANVFVRRFDVKLRTPDALHVALCRRHDLNLDRRRAQALGIKAQMLLQA